MSLADGQSQEAQEKQDNTDLARSIWDSRLRLADFQKEVFRLVQNYVGRSYGPETAVDRRPINQLALAVITYQHRLMSANPRVLCTTARVDLKTAALERESALNAWILRTNAAVPLMQAVIGALFGFGIIKVGVAPDRARAYDDPGKVGIWAIGMDDWVQDMMAKTWDDMAYCGHRYRVKTKKLLEDDSIPEERRRQIMASPRTQYNEFGNKKIEATSQGTRYPLEYGEYTELWEIWLPDQQKIKTFIGTGTSAMFDTDPIRVVHWEGPTHGPYHKLEFHPVLDNNIGKPPVSMYSDLDEAMNVIANKVIRQAQGQKKILLHEKSSDPADVNAVNSCKDGQSVQVTRPEQSKEVSLGGPDQTLAALLIQLRGLFSIQAGNIDQLGGLQTQAPTAHQEELLAQSASQTLNSMQSNVMAWLQRIFTDVDFWLFSDPQLNLQAEQKLPSGSAMPFTMTSGMVKGQSEDYFVEITPYSHVYRTPEDRLNAILGAIQSILPIAQAAMQGAPFDVEALVKIIARYQGIPELEDVYRNFDPAEDPQQNMQQQQQPTQGAQNSGPAGFGGETKRTYERVDRHQARPQEQENKLLSTLMASKNSNQ